MSLAFGAEHRDIYDSIDQSGATLDFTVGCVRRLLGRGCVGSRHALSLLLETVRGDAGDQHQGSFQSLIDELDGSCRTIPSSGFSDLDVAGPPAVSQSPTLAAQTAGAAMTESGSSLAAPRFPAGPSQRPAGGGKRDFFVSYTGADKDWAEWIAWQLEEAGYSSEIQSWGFHAGGNFILDMHRAASRTHRTIAVQSSEYLAAQYTPPEWAAALAQEPTGEKRLFIPVSVSDCQPDGLMRAVTYVDLVGLDEASAKQTLVTRISGERLKPSRPPGFPGAGASSASPQPGFPGPPQALGDLHAALLAGQPAPGFDEQALQQILRHSPRTLEEYRLARITEWSQARYGLDKRFTRLTLLLDQGPEAQGARWQAQQHTFGDLRDVLGKAQEPALVLLGPPGCGTGTLLRRLEIDLAADALRAADPEPACRSFFVAPNRYRPARPGEAMPAPRGRSVNSAIRASHAAPEHTATTCSRQRYTSLPAATRSAATKGGTKTSRRCTR